MPWYARTILVGFWTISACDASLSTSAFDGGTREPDSGRDGAGLDARGDDGDAMSSADDGGSDAETVRADAGDGGPSPGILPAFPGAEGWGARAVGGRGGEVFFVTATTDDGPIATGRRFSDRPLQGDFRNALMSRSVIDGRVVPRTVVFRVSGYIDLQNTILVRGMDFLTIAGQTAPGGVCVRNRGVRIYGADNTVIRHMRFRDSQPDSNNDGDALSIGWSPNDASTSVWEPGMTNSIVDHCSASWGYDEVFDMQGTSTSTGQWNLIYENLSLSHKFGTLLQGQDISWHHNLTALMDTRPPLLATPGIGGDRHDIRNNVAYNLPNGNTIEGGFAIVNPDDGRYQAPTQANIINSYHRRGPDSPSTIYIAATYCQYRESQVEGPSFFLSGNLVDGWTYPRASDWEPLSGSNPGLLYAAWSIRRTWVDESTGVEHDTPGYTGRLSTMQLAEPLPAAWVDTQEAQAAYASMVANDGVGALIFQNDPLTGALELAEVTRDTADSGAIAAVVNRTRRTPGGPKPESVAAAGGWPTLGGGVVPLDTDDDGMPDLWEVGHGLEPRDDRDRNDDGDRDGYTNLEEYLNGTDPRECVNYRRDLMSGAIYTTCPR